MFSELDRGNNSKGIADLVCCTVVLRLLAMMQVRRLRAGTLPNRLVPPRIPVAGLAILGAVELVLGTVRPCEPTRGNLLH